MATLSYIQCLLSMLISVSLVCFIRGRKRDTIILLLFHWQNLRQQILPCSHENSSLVALLLRFTAQQQCPKSTRALYVTIIKNKLKAFYFSMRALGFLIMHQNMVLRTLLLNSFLCAQAPEHTLIRVHHLGISHVCYKCA